MSRVFQLSLSNSERIIADSIYIIEGNELKNIYDIFFTQSQASTINGLDPATIIILQDIASTIGNNSTFFTDIYDPIALKSNLSETYSRTYINNLISDYYTKSQTDALLNNKLNSSEINNYYNKTFIDTNLATINTNLGLKLDSSAISNYYNKSETDAIFNQDKHRLKCAVVEFSDVLNLGVDTLSIIGSTNIAITDSSSNNLINMSATSINITPPLQCFSNVNITGTLTASSMYNKSQVDGLIANVASLQNVYTKGETDTLLNLKRNITNTFSISEVNAL